MSVMDMMTVEITVMKKTVEQLNQLLHTQLHTQLQLMYTQPPVCMYICKLCMYIYTVEPPITDHPRDRQPPYNRQSLWHGLKSLLHIILSQPPRNGRFSVLDSGQNLCSLTAFFMQNCLHNEHHGSCPHKINPLSTRSVRNGFADEGSKVTSKNCMRKSL